MARRTPPSSFALSFHGAAGEVTGSQHLLETSGGLNVLLDCGMFQGKRESAVKKNCCFGYDPSKLDAVLLSHAHVDHSGLIPKLEHEGFSGNVYCTAPTRDLCRYLLLDSAKIQQEDEAYFQRHAIRTPLLSEPLYTEEDVQNVLKRFVVTPYEQEFSLSRDVGATLYDAGHVLGSAMIEVRVKTDQGRRTIVYTGDLGRRNEPLTVAPHRFSEADILIIESTYGDREHERILHLEEDLKKTIVNTIQRGGKILIPAFALERTQDMILRLRELMDHHLIPEIPIFVDSPLATNMTQVFEEYLKRSFSFPNLRFTPSREQSKAINLVKGPCIIIAGSGMCENGRIRHHLQQHIGDERNTVLIVGFQAEDTLGRKLIEGKRVVSIFGQQYGVRAEIAVLKSMSAHADEHDLDEFVRSMKGLKKIFLVHGEPTSREAFAKRISTFYKSAEVILPERGGRYELE